MTSTSDSRSEEAVIVFELAKRPEMFLPSTKLCCAVAYVQGYFGARLGRSFAPKPWFLEKLGLAQSNQVWWALFDQLLAREQPNNQLKSEPEHQDAIRLLAECLQDYFRHRVSQP